MDDHTRYLTDQNFMGTFLYAAPEVLEEHTNEVPNPDLQQSDMWALGVIVFFLLSGEYPFAHGNEKKLISAIMSCNYDFVPEAIWN